MGKFVVFALIVCSVLGCSTKAPQSDSPRARILSEMKTSMKKELLDVWYPRNIDREHGGYLSTFTYDFKPTGEQDKMIVSQARHVWTNSKAALLYPDDPSYLENAHHGFVFLRDVMWDKSYGGFYTLVDKRGDLKGEGSEEKTAYGNAFAIYGLAAYYKSSGDTSALNLARRAFQWLENYSHDSINNGYYQHLSRTGTITRRPAEPQPNSEIGLKDQNSSIHLLEAFTELYQVWPDPLVKARLEEMLVLIRDRIVQPAGYLGLFFQPDWTLLSFRDSTETAIRANFNLDHVSFGHDVETAFLMLEATHILGNTNDSVTLNVAKRMVDHTLKNGWDNELGGFYDGGYYFKGNMGITIVKDSKNWWSQAEGLNSLLMMAELYPNDSHNYFQQFVKLWDYTNKYIIDHEHGEWYQGGLDKEPEQKTALKGHIWKASYHQFRALMNCVERLEQEPKGH